MKKYFLKHKLKKLYLKINYGFEEYGCGHNMLLNMSSEYYRACKRFNRIADKLSKIDSSTPTFRYKVGH